jgi:hypothetical protein
MSKRQRQVSKEQNTNESQSVFSLAGTQQLQERASRSTEGIFSQMLSRSK